MSKQLVDIRERAARATADFGSAADEVDEAAAATLGINRTDLRILGLVWAAGSLTAGAVAAKARLSPAATTTAVQRLVTAGHLRRQVDPDDRRRARVTVTESTAALINEIYGPVGSAGEALLAGYSAPELVLLTRFLEAGRQLQLDQAERIRALRG